MSGVDFLNVPVDSPEFLLLLTKVLLRMLHDDHHQNKAEQACANRGQRENPAVVEHHHERTHQHRDRGDQRAEALAQRLPDRVHVVGHVA
ncbi:hypothetical protein SDC9_175960 [bioreactor metagenome]|uniref:Uncharacterized protein n=1 Tax=bioreactor metagenome TaxID=1076179 RepID=A0A645GNM3_9ZZZZ